MKIKYTKAPSHTGYLGHFRGCLKEGHNTTSERTLKESVRADVVKRDETPVKRTVSHGIRG